MTRRPLRSGPGNLISRHMQRLVWRMPLVVELQVAFRYIRSMARNDMSGAYLDAPVRSWVCIKERDVQATTGLLKGAEALKYPV